MTVGDDVEAHLDTGITSVAALAHGARFTLIGRAYLCGLMAGGRDGHRPYDRDPARPARTHHAAAASPRSTSTPRTTSRSWYGWPRVPAERAPVTAARRTRSATPARNRNRPPCRARRARSATGGWRPWARERAAQPRQPVGSVEPALVSKPAGSARSAPRAAAGRQ
ncbi:MAG: alpha-hydroxy-acid oxidizing protein [Micromonosporaceae bacterium]